MDPKRRAELDAYFNTMGRGPHSAGITPPTEAEFAEWQRGQQITDSGQRATLKNTTVTKGTIKPTGNTSSRVSNMRTGTTRNDGEPLDVATSDRVSNLRGTASPAGTTGGTTGGGARSGGSSSTPSPTAGGGEQPRERSSWSEFLHQALDEFVPGQPGSLRVPFEQHPRQVFDRYMNVAQPGVVPQVPSTMPGQVPSQRGPMPAPMMDPRMQAMSPTMAPGSPTMTNFSNAMQRVQPMMQRPMQEPRFSAQPMAQPNMPSFERSYSPPPSYRTSQPNDAQMLMDRFRSTGSIGY